MTEYLDTSKLVEVLDKFPENDTSVARAMGMSPACFHQKKYGKRRFTVPEAYRLCIHLGIPLVDMCIYFQ